MTMESEVVPTDDRPSWEPPAAPLSSRALVGLLADPARRAVFAALVLGDDEPASISARSGCSMRDTVAALDRMVAAGLVEAIDGGRFHLLAQAFQLAARREAPPEPASDFDDETEDRRRILDQALRNGRLVAWPAKYSRRLVVLDHIAQRFEPGRHYSEREVNVVLAAIDSDTATVRRYLVDAGFLDRADGAYWRSGGTFPIG